jgi:hypothetical protein
MLVRHLGPEATNAGRCSLFPRQRSEEEAVEDNIKRNDMVHAIAGNVVK